MPEPVILTDNVVPRDDASPYTSNGLPYASDDEPFAHLVDKKYKDRYLHYWEPAPPVYRNPNEPGYMGKNNYLSND